jgi:transcriptional regulator of acetoin/glycerol metabolism
MLSFHWPGNVRELQSTVESAVSLTRGQYVSADDLGLAGSIHMKKMLFDKETIMNVLKITNGNVTVASKHLGVTRRTLYRYLRQHEIKPMRE